MSFIANKIRGIRHRAREATVLPTAIFRSRPLGMFRMRRFLYPHWNLTCYVQSRSGAWHYLSADEIDDLVVLEMLGRLESVYFPSALESLRPQLENGGTVLDVGGFGGGWSVEMMSRFPGVESTLIESSADRCHCVRKTLAANKAADRYRLVEAGLASKVGTGWLVDSSEGSWGDWVEELPPANVQSRLVTTTDYRSAIQGKTPLVVKCNCEGGEFALVEQLLSEVEHPRFMILMVHPERGNMVRFLSQLDQMHYHVTEAIADEHRPCFHAWK